MKKERPKIINLQAVPRSYRPESIKSRLDREAKRIAEMDKETMRKFDEITGHLYKNKKDRD